jgi:hypothetical protein
VQCHSAVNSRVRASRALVCCRSTAQRDGSVHDCPWLPGVPSQPDFEGTLASVTRCLARVVAGGNRGQRRRAHVASSVVSRLRQLQVCGLNRLASAASSRTALPREDASTRVRVGGVHPHAIHAGMEVGCLTDDRHTAAPNVLICEGCACPRPDLGHLCPDFLWLVCRQGVRDDRRQGQVY